MVPSMVCFLLLVLNQSTILHSITRHTKMPQLPKTSQRLNSKRLSQRMELSAKCTNGPSSTGKVSLRRPASQLSRSKLTPLDQLHSKWVTTKWASAGRSQSNKWDRERKLPSLAQESLLTNQLIRLMMFMATSWDVNTSLRSKNAPCIHYTLSHSSWEPTLASILDHLVSVDRDLTWPSLLIQLIFIIHKATEFITLKLKSLLVTKLTTRPNNGLTTQLTRQFRLVSGMVKWCSKVPTET